MFFQSLIDSLAYYLREMRIAPQIAIGDLIALSAFILAYVQFKKQLALAREDREKAQRAEWFLNVIVLPHLRGLHNFYYDLIEDVKSRCVDLDNSYRRNIGEQAFAVELADQKNQSRKLITAYFDELEPMVRSYDNKLGDRLAELAMNLQDVCSDILSQYNRNDVVNEIKIKLLSHKQSVLSILGEVMSVNNL